MAIVALSWLPSEEELARIQRSLPQSVELRHLPRRLGLSRFDCPAPFLAEMLTDANVLMGWVQIPSAIVASATQLQFVAWLHAGCDRLDLQLLARRGIRVANVRGANAVPVAEHAIALMLGLAKRLRMNLESVRDARWHGWWDEASVSTELNGKTICIVGYGNIGRVVARICGAFGMRVLAIRRSGRDGEEGSREVTFGDPSRMQEFFAMADFIVLALPLTAQTRGLIGQEALAWMKPGCYLVNVARGDLVQEEALSDALVAGRLVGYAADVWWQYGDAQPPGGTFPTHSRLGVHRLPNVFATSESASNLLVVKDRMIEMGLESVRAFLVGDSIPRIVDLELGY